LKKNFSCCTKLNSYDFFCNCAKLSNHEDIFIYFSLFIITLYYLSYEELKASYRDCNDAKTRMPAMLQIWDGKLSLEVAKDIHMTAPCFRKRVHRYNEYGIAGLIDTWHSNRKSYFSQEQKETVIEAWQKPPSECGFSKSNRTMPLQKSENSYVWHSKTY
jgi:transposase